MVATIAVAIAIAIAVAVAVAISVAVAITNGCLRVRFRTGGRHGFAARVCLRPRSC